MSNTDHHPFGPSSLGRRDACPGSYREEQGLDSIPSDAAEEGTRLHAEIAGVLSKEFDISTVDQDDYVLVEAAVDFCESLNNSPAPWLVEERMILVDDGPHELLFGTLDAIQDNEDWGVVVDHKLGWLPIPEQDIRWQLIVYCAMAIQLHAWKYAEGYAHNPRTGEVRKCRVTAAEVPHVVKRVKDVIAKCEEPDAPLATGDHCKYCNARGTCSASQKELQNVANAFEKPESRNDMITAVHRIPPERFATIEQALPRLSWFLDAVRYRIRQGLTVSPDYSKTYHLKEVGSARSITAPHVWQAVKHRIHIDDFAACSKVHVSQLESKYIEESQRLADEAGEKLTKKAAREEFNELIGPFVTQDREIRMEAKK